MIKPDLIAYIAGVILMLSYLPQLAKTIKSKKVEDLSLVMLLATFTSSVLYEIYAYILNLIPVIIMNGIFTLTVLLQLIIKIRYNQRNHKKLIK